MPTFKCRVIGIPAPQGSKRAFVIPGKAGGKARAIITESNKKQGSWRDTMSNAFVATMDDTDFEDAIAYSTRPIFQKVAVNVAAVFIMPRPQSQKKATYHITSPDLDKLQRTVGDSLQESCVLANDSAIVSWDGTVKRYANVGEPVGLDITVTVKE